MTSCSRGRDLEKSVGLAPQACKRRFDPPESPNPPIHTTQSTRYDPQRSTEEPGFFENSRPIFTDGGAVGENRAEIMANSEFLKD